MDALNASATANKKDAKKRKRRPSASKDTNKDSTNTTAERNAAGSPPTSSVKSEIKPDITSPSALELKDIAAPNFYQDTLKSEVKKEENGDEEEENENKSLLLKKARPSTPTEMEADEEENTMVIDEEDKRPKALKSVLFHGKRRPGPKRSVKWKEESELVEIQYFELDETERVNVTRAFTDAAKMELCGEREALQLSRKTPHEDLMDPQIPWRTPLIEIEINPPPPEIVVRSLEKDIQFAREKSCLQALYFSKRTVPDSPGEPDPEHHQITDPVSIPLDPVDEEQQEESKGPPPPWPEPKASPPPPAQPQVPPPQFNQQHPMHINHPHPGGPMVHPNQQMPIPQQGPMGLGPGFPGPQFMGPQGNFHPQQNIQAGPQPFQGGMPGPFGAPGNFMPSGPGGGGGANMMMDWNMQGMMQPQMGGMPDQQQIMPNGGPGMFGQQEFNNMHENFPPQFMQNQQNFQHNQQMGGGNFGGRGRGGNFRRGNSGGGGGGNGPWVRMNGPNNWNNRGGGGGDRSGSGGRGGRNDGGGPRICKNIKNHGYCRNRDNCQFYHPPV